MIYIEQVTKAEFVCSLCVEARPDPGLSTAAEGNRILAWSSAETLPVPASIWQTGVQPSPISNQNATNPNPLERSQSSRYFYLSEQY